MAQSCPDIDANKKGVTVDENGVPYYKWPPFPDPPEGLNIIPFNDFKPSGIQISFNDDVEVDGLGIPTVRLAVTHDNEAPPKKKSKTKKTPAGEEVRRRNVWWEEWAEGEEQRIRSVRTYDQMLHAKARVAHAIEDFQRLHDWEPVSSRLKEWFGKLLYFLGQNDVTIRPRFRRMREEDIQPDDEDDADDAASDAQKPPEPCPIKINKFDEQKHKLRENAIGAEQEERLRQKVTRVREMQELRLEAFIDNPELATKIFLSSYFRDCGMMWEKMALRDAPRILEFFLKFLLETRALYEEEASLKKALEIARRAKEELPLTMKIGVNMPDELAQCLKAMYGSRVKQLLWTDELEPDTTGAEFKAQVEESGGMIISDLVSGPASEPANGNTAGVELPQAEETTGGWSSIGVDTTGWGGGNWASDNNEDGNNNPWAQTTTTTTTTTSTHVWAQPEVHNLMTLLGPTTLPLTHTVGYVEESTRYVSSVTLPGEDVKLSWHDDKGVTSSDLFRSFAQVILKPYPRFAAPTAPRAAIQPPELLEDPWSKVSSDSTEKPRVPRHNPKKDSITVLIDPELGKDLALGRRMGLGGTFVQVVPRHDDADNESEKASDGITFWYAEKILQIIPSFWTEKQI